MRTQTVNADTAEEALNICIWAEAVREVDSGVDGQLAWLCFENETDALLWDAQI